MTPYYDSGDGRCVLWQGDVMDCLRELPSESVQCVVTSPPYWGLRDYGVPGQIGLEPTMQEYVARMVDVFREVRRVLRTDGTCWVNLGDSYAANGHSGRDEGYNERTGRGDIIRQNRDRIVPDGLKPKDLCGIPWRVAFALQADGWYLRSDIIWSKPNPMPESVTDRPTKAHEYVFLLTKSARYYYDAEAVRECWADDRMGNPGVYHRTTAATKGANNDRADLGFLNNGGGWTRGEQMSGRNRRTVWEIATQAYPEAHFATYPEKLVEPCVLAGTSEHACCAECGKPWERILDKSRTFESGSGKAGHMPVGKNGEGLQGGGETGDVRRGPCVHITTLGWQPACKCNAGVVPCTVLDPFSGSGTSGLVALRLGRRYIGIDLSADYLDMSLRRLEPVLAQSTLDFTEAPL